MFSSWVGKIPWRGEWLPTPVFLPGGPHGQRRVVGYGRGVTKSWTRRMDRHLDRNPAGPGAGQQRGAAAQTPQEVLTLRAMRV